MVHKTTTGSNTYAQKLNVLNTVAKCVLAAVSYFKLLKWRNET